MHTVHGCFLFVSIVLDSGCIFFCCPSSLRLLSLSLFPFHVHGVSFENLFDVHVEWFESSQMFDAIKLIENVSM